MARTAGKTAAVPPGRRASKPMEPAAVTEPQSRRVGKTLQRDAEPKPDGVTRVGMFHPLAGVWPLPDNATVLDFAFATEGDVALRLIGAKVNGAIAPLSQRLTLGDVVECVTSDLATPSARWLEFAGSPAREIIKLQLNLPVTEAERAVYDNAMRRRSNPPQPGEPDSFPAEAVAETTTRAGYRQPGREGKKLIGAYVPEKDIPRFKALLKARGTNTQEFFAQIFANELAAAGNPAELERLMEAQLERFRATFRHLLPTPKR